MKCRYHLKLCKMNEHVYIILHVFYFFNNKRLQKSKYFLQLTSNYCHKAHNRQKKTVVSFLSLQDRTFIKFRFIAEAGILYLSFYRMLRACFAGCIRYTCCGRHERSEESCWQYVNFTISLLSLRFFGRCAPSSMTNYGSATIFSSFIITLYSQR